MKKLILLFTFIWMVNCFYHKTLNEDEIANFYTNYSITLTDGDNRFYLYPDEGNIQVHYIFLTQCYTYRNIYFYPMEGSTYYDYEGTGWNSKSFSGSWSFDVPEGDDKPSIIKIIIKTGCTETMYLYMYNLNYKIPLSLSNYYLYQIILKDLEINYEITVLDEDVNINFESTIEYPQLYDKFNLSINENNYIFNESSLLKLSLNKGTTYSIKFKAALLSPVSTKSYFFIYLGKERNYNSLYYPTNYLTYMTILSNYKWYIIDTINSIDNYNSYKLSIIEGYQDKIDNKLNIRIKKYDTYDIEHIKHNLPISNDDYDEKLELEYDNSLTFKVCENCLNSRTILIQIDLNYLYDGSFLYKYKIEKIKPKQGKSLEFTKYDINWYLNYEFIPINVKSQDIILISTNHSNTVFPSKLDGNRLFESFYNGQLFVSFADEDTERNKVTIEYSIEDAKISNDKDVGHMEVYQLNNEFITFEVINFNEEIQNKLYYFEMTKSNDKYFYIKIDGYMDFYILYEGEDIYSFLTVEKMPVEVKKFCQSNIINDTTLLSYKDEYLVKIGYSKLAYDLINLYIMKNELSRSFKMEEGGVRMITFIPNENEMNIQINILENHISNKSYIYLRIPSKNINDNLYVIYSDNIYILNNTGIKIYNEQLQYQINLKIKNNDNINYEIPFLVQLGCQQSKFKYITNYNDYEFNQGIYGIMKYKEDKIINLKFKMELSSLSFSYYNCYLPEDYIDDTLNIINPELFKTIKLNTNEYNFIINTKLDLEREIVKNNILRKENLYLIFSFNGNAKVSTGDTESFYYKSILSYTTMLSSNKWYIIDSINLIDNYNNYKFSIIDGYQGKIDNKLNIRIKKYNTYDINYIKNNIPTLDDDYDEKLNLDYNNDITFKVCENCVNYKTILIQIDLNYESSKSSLYQYQIEKINDYKPLQNKIYNLNWYTTYEFSSMNVQSQDIILITTNHILIQFLHQN